MKSKKQWESEHGTWAPANYYKPEDLKQFENPDATAAILGAPAIVTPDTLLPAPTETEASATEANTVLAQEQEDHIDELKAEGRIDLVDSATEPTPTE